MINGNNTNPISQTEINEVLWQACIRFSGNENPEELKDYIAIVLFLKYISDEWWENYYQLIDEYGNDRAEINRRLREVRFVMNANCTFGTLLQHRNRPNLGELINSTLAEIENLNANRLRGVFDGTDFNSETRLGQRKERNNRLASLLLDFHDSRLDFRPSRTGNLKVAGDAFEYLTARFASVAERRVSDFYTPPEVASLVAKLINPQPGERICDPGFGLGSMLIKCAHEVGNKGVSLWGQEVNPSYWTLAKMNVLMHGFNQANLELGDLIRSPRLLSGDNLMTFQVVVSHVPFSLKNWGREEAELDSFGRFDRGLPSNHHGQFAFISHMIETATENSGRVGVVVPYGVLFRRGSEGRIREQLIEENIVDTVVRLPSNLFYPSSVPAAILLLNKSKSDKKVLFIDADQNNLDTTTRRQKLTDQIIENIVAAYKARKNVNKFAYVADLDRIKANDFELHIPHYVKTR